MYIYIPVYTTQYMYICIYVYIYVQLDSSVCCCLGYSINTTSVIFRTIVDASHVIDYYTAFGSSKRYYCKSLLLEVIKE